MPESTEQHTKTKNRFLLIGNGIIVLATLLCFVLAFFIPGMQILALAIALSPVFTPLLTLALGTISAILWTAGCTFVHWLITKKSLNDTHQLDNPKEPLKTNTTSPQDQKIPFVEVVHKTLFPTHFEETKLQSMFPDLIYRRVVGRDGYRQLKNSYIHEACHPKEYGIYIKQLPSRGTQGTSYEIKNEVTHETMLEIPFYRLALGDTNAWAIPVSKENSAIIRQMIKANYCDYFADKHGKPTPAANMVTAELDKIESTLKTNLTL